MGRVKSSVSLCKWHDYTERLARHLLVGDGVSESGRRKQVWKKGILESRRGCFRPCEPQMLFLQGHEYSEFAPEESHTCSVPCSVWVWTAVFSVWLQKAGTVQMWYGRLGR